MEGQNKGHRPNSSLMEGQNKGQEPVHECTECGQPFEAQEAYQVFYLMCPDCVQEYE